LAGANTLAYFVSATATKKKSLKALAPQFLATFRKREINKA
jgi:hypothetical protein